MEGQHQQPPKNVKQPKMIPNPLYCERCKGRDYVVYDAEWEPYAVECFHPDIFKGG